jgi:hypothetical protein
MSVEWTAEEKSISWTRTAPDYGTRVRWPTDTSACSRTRTLHTGVAMQRCLAVTPVVALLAALTSPAAAAAQDRPYTEGPVVAVSYIRIKPGMFDKYM